MTADESRRAQDMITAMEAQRNEFLTQIVYLHADLSAAKRRIAELEALPKTTVESNLLLSNGHAKEEQPASPPC